MDGECKRYILIYKFWLCVYIGCINILSTHVITNNSTNNNVFFFVSNFKIVYYKNLLILDLNTLDMRGKNILPHYLFGDKIIQNCLKIDTTH